MYLIVVVCFAFVFVLNYSTFQKDEILRKDLRSIWFLKISKNGLFRQILHKYKKENAQVACSCLH